MMPLKLNLLSPDKKRKFLSVARFLFVKEMLEFIILTLAILAMMYLFAWWVVTQAMSDVVSSALMVNREAPPINKDVKELNRVTKNVVTSAQFFEPVSPYVLDIVNKLPQDIKLVNVILDRTAGNLVISGTAADRMALINFQKTIEGITWLKNPSTPSNELLQKENIDFEIKAALKGIPLIKKN